MARTSQHRQFSEAVKALSFPWDFPPFGELPSSERDANFSPINTEFKEIRKEWKARKKEEEAARKAEEERQRAAASAQSAADPQSATDGTQPPTTYPGTRAVQLPPIGYQPTQYPAPPSGGMQGSLPTDYGNTGHVYGSYNSPNSPYGAPNQQMYNQREPHY